MSGPTLATEMPCTKSELDVFQPVPVQVAMTEGRWHTYYPLQSISGSPEQVEFLVPGVHNECVDMNNISIYVRGKIKSGANADLGAVADLTGAPVNNWLGSLFKHVDLNVNGQLLTRASREYAYKDFFKKLLYYQMPKGGTEKTQAECFGWYPDTIGEADHAATAAQPNLGCKERAGWIAGSKSFELRGPVCLDLFETERLLLPGVDMTLRFLFNDPLFYMMDDTATGRYKLELEEVVLYVRRVTVGESFVREMNDKLARQDAIYPFTRREITSFTIAAGSSSVVKENLFRGQVATRYFVALVDSAAFNGISTGNPYHFKPYNLNEVSLMENGQCIAGQPIRLNVTTSRTMDAYYQLLESIGGIGERAHYPPLTMDAWLKNHTIFCFTRAPDLCHGDSALPTQFGNLTLRLSMSAALAASVTCVVMAEFDSRIQINKDRVVSTDFSV